MKRRKQALGIRTAAARAETLGAADVTLRGTYWYDLRARDPIAARLKRFCDIAIATPVAILTAPLLLFNGIERERRVGFRGNEFDVYVSRGRFLKSLPKVLNVLNGTMSLVGPRAMSPDEVENYDARRFSVRPGWTGLWDIREGREHDLDREYVNEWSLARDLAILTRAALRLGGPRR